MSIHSNHCLCHALFLLTIQNCFRKASIERKEEAQVTPEIIAEETMILPENVAVNVFDEIDNIDADIPCHGKLTGAEIIEEVQVDVILEEVGDETEAEDDVSEEVISASQALEMINEINGFFNNSADDLKDLKLWKTQLR